MFTCMHASLVQGSTISLAVATSQTVNRHRRVKVTSSGTVQHAGLTDKGEGIADTPKGASAAAGELVSVLDRKTPGSVLGIASEAINVGDVVYSAANGKYSKTSGGGAVQEGKALTAASGDGSEFTVKLDA